MRCRLPLCVLLLVAIPHAGLAQSALATGTTPGIPWLRLILSFLFCIALAAGAAVLLKKGQGNTPRLRNLLPMRMGNQSLNRITIVEARRIGRSAQLCVVEFDNRQLLLAVTDRHIEILTESDCEAAGPIGGNDA